MPPNKGARGAGSAGGTGGACECGASNRTAGPLSRWACAPARLRAAGRSARCASAGPSSGLGPPGPIPCTSNSWQLRVSCRARAALFRQCSAATMVPGRGSGPGPRPTRPRRQRPRAPAGRAGPGHGPPPSTRGTSAFDRWTLRVARTLSTPSSPSLASPAHTRPHSHEFRQAPGAITAAGGRRQTHWHTRQVGTSSAGRCGEGVERERRGSVILV